MIVLTEKPAIADHQAEYYSCVAKIKHMAGLPAPKAPTLKQSLLENKFSETIGEAVHCSLFDYWPLSEQIHFLDAIAALSPEEKSVRAHEQAYFLFKLKNS